MEIEKKEMAFLEYVEKSALFQTVTLFPRESKNAATRGGNQFSEQIFAISKFLNHLHVCRGCIITGTHISKSMHDVRNAYGPWIPNKKIDT